MIHLKPGSSAKTTSMWGGIAGPALCPTDDTLLRLEWAMIEPRAAVYKILMTAETDSGSRGPKSHRDHMFDSCVCSQLFRVDSLDSGPSISASPYESESVHLVKAARREKHGRGTGWRAAKPWVRGNLACRLLWAARGRCRVMAPMD